MSQLHMHITGSGRPLVLIHGWGMHGGVWQPVVKKLAKHFELHIVDLPGMGFSQDISAESLPGIIQALLPQLPAEADVCGWSLGGLVSMNLALTQPQRVRRLVLVGSTPRFINTAADSQHPWVNGMAAAVFEKFARQVGEDYQTTLLKFLTLQCMGACDARATIKQLRLALAERPVPSASALQQALNVLLDNDLRAQVASLQQETLLIHGDRDTLAPVQAANWLAQHLPAAQLRVIAGAGHAPFLSHAAQFVESLTEFLQAEQPRHFSTPELTA
ncbi:pimeloyl-ACP methyl ester esterase BioH [Methylobacillus gramineus]|uniref:pimeloyl-ACP methyl ester esterase BioH n=1 Tax=Methylobacillus gramineus TaxID=755169 RepID=UPI001CFF63D7|nr:pimeloyl-ACP methyl ester esterase BioH [Methylobacillus gramineus]MCB5186309.1 pimeloyl-ACP methyl ester esterase BioH [Methylobacillus gramineus]